MLRRRKFIPVPILVLLIVPWAVLFFYQKYLQQKVIHDTSIIPPEGINSLEKIRLGGIDQWVLIRGWDRMNPVLLFLHGGPGAPLFTYCRDIGVTAKLEQHFVMVYWEQRGTGKSFSPSIPAETMTIEQFVSDTHELSQILRKRFGVERIFLLGRSWGSLIGILCAHRHPEIFHAYVGIGQMVNPTENDSISYQFTLETAASLGNEEAVEELKEIGPPPYDHRDLRVQRRWLTSFSNIPDSQEPSSKKRLLSTPEYSLFDIIKMGIDPYFSTKHLWDEELYQMNLMEQAPSIEVPVYFLVGRHDYFTPSQLVVEYYERLIAPQGKELIWFEESGHEPELQEPEKFYDIMVNKVLKEINNPPGFPRPVVQ